MIDAATLLAVMPLQARRYLSQHAASMDRNLREIVRRRAAGRCEYRRIAQASEAFFRFHIEHVITKQHGGATVGDNLALACHFCNLHKGPNIAGIAPQSGEMAALFHPRRNQWTDHFEEVDGVASGRIPAGRATVAVLQMNDSSRVELRST